MDRRLAPRTYHAKSLALVRIEHGMTQDELAKRIGVNRVAIGRWEAGLAKPSADNILKLCGLFGCKIEDLLE